MSSATTQSGPELIVRQDGPVLWLTLDRPGKRNALSQSLVAAIHDAFVSLTPETRAVILAANGLSFCAGGDIGEFAEAARLGTADAEAEALAAMFEAMTLCPVPIIGRVQGAAFGGGVGLVSCVDIAIAGSEARFSLSEARLGLVAAVISRHVIDALGWRAARAHMLLGAPFDAEEALRIGLVHRVVDDEVLDEAVDEAIVHLLTCAPGALATIKRLPELLHGQDQDAAATRAATTRILADCLRSEETQEGLRAFLEKRPPSWVTTREQA